MCHGRIAPKSSSEFVVTSVGHGVFLQLVILCSLLGDGLASGKSDLPFVFGRGRLYTRVSPGACVLLFVRQFRKSFLFDWLVLFCFIVWYVQQEASSLKPDRARWGTCCWLLYRPSPQLLASSARENPGARAWYTGEEMSWVRLPGFRAHSYHCLWPWAHHCYCASLVSSAAEWVNNSIYLTEGCKGINVT